MYLVSLPQNGHGLLLQPLLVRLGVLHDLVPLGWFYDEMAENVLLDAQVVIHFFNTRGFHLVVIDDEISFHVSFHRIRKTAATPGVFCNLLCTHFCKKSFDFLQQSLLFFLSKDGVEHCNLIDGVLLGGWLQRWHDSWIRIHPE